MDFAHDAVDGYKEQCKEELDKDAEATLPPPVFCPNDCNDHGKLDMVYVRLRIRVRDIILQGKPSVSPFNKGFWFYFLALHYCFSGKCYF